MTEPHEVSALRPTVLGAPLEAAALATVSAWRREHAPAAIAAAVAVPAVWVTVRADFLTHPEWLAVPKADFRSKPAIGGPEDAR